MLFIKCANPWGRSDFFKLLEYPRSALVFSESHYFQVQYAMIGIFLYVGKLFSVRYELNNFTYNVFCFWSSNG
jgi:hypothetical protein